MSTTFLTSTKLQQPATNDLAWDGPVNQNSATLDGFVALGALCVTAHEVPSTSLHVAVSAGVFADSTGTPVAYAGAASVTLSDNTTTRLWLTDAGALATGAAFPAATTRCVRLASVVTVAGMVAQVVDARVPLRSAGLAAPGPLAVTPHEVPSASLNVAVSAGTFVDSTGAYVSYAGVSSSALADNTTTALWLTDAGALATGAGFPAPATKCVRLATVTTLAGVVTAVADGRVLLVSAG